MLAATMHRRLASNTLMMCYIGKEGSRRANYPKWAREGSGETYRCHARTKQVELDVQLAMVDASNTEHILE